MELATVNLKLSGDANNVVVLKNVTPAELVVMAAMHGEDCADKIVVKKIDKKRSTRFELERLQTKFDSEHSAKTLRSMFPGANPNFPMTFHAAGFYADYDLPEGQEKVVEKIKEENTKPAAENILQKKIAEQAKMREKAKAGTAYGVPVIPAADGEGLIAPDAGFDPLTEGDQGFDPIDQAMNGA